MSFKIGNIQIDNPVIVAPMAGVTDYSFRGILKKQGAGLIYTEMVSDKALCYGNEKTFSMLDVASDERPVSLQLFGNEIASMVEAAKIIEEKSAPDIIDINAGCPVHKIVKSGSGSKLLTNPEHLAEIIYQVSNAIDTPLTVKIRTGWDNHSINAEKVALLAQEAGVKALAIHGRTRAQMYSGKADWEIIKHIKSILNIPVIGNGDISSPLEAKKRLLETNVDGIMVGRALMGNPFLIKEISHYLKTGEELTPPSSSETIDMALEHLDNIVNYKGEKLASLQMRSHLTWYLKGLKGASTVKRLLTQQNSTDKMRQILLDYKDELLRSSE